MSTFKRCISVLLVLVMVISMVPAQAAAEGYRTALEKSSELGDVLGKILEQRPEDHLPEAPEVIQEAVTDTVTPQAVTTNPVPIASGTFNGHQYYYFPSNSMNWEEAKQFCLSQGGYLAAIGSQEENDFLYNLIRSAGGANAHFGLTDEEESRVWRWVNGEEVVYTNWASGEPNSTSEHHAMFYEKFTDGKWNDGVFSGSPFLLEMETAAGTLSGSCGDGVAWTYDNGVLTISGSGTINDYAFVDHTGITAVVIGEGITGIGRNAFRNCAKLTDLTLPESLTTIGSWAFENCTGLKAILMPEGVTSINYRAFANCDSLTEVTLPASLTATDRIFEDCDNVQRIVFAEGASMVPDSIFWNLTSEFEIMIPDGVTTIGSRAFDNCIGLKAIRIPEGVTSINYRAFANCDSLTEVVLPASLTAADRIFEDCDNMQRIVIAEGASNIPDYIFWNLTSAFEITIPDGVTTIGSRAFDNCTGLKAILMPEGVTSINYRAFANCDSLTEVTLPASITAADRIFEDCDNVQRIVIAEGASNIPNNIFWNLTSAFEITIPDGVTTIGSRAFDNCIGLKAIRIPEGVTSINNRAFANCDSLTEVTLPASITAADRIFEDCDNVQRIIIAEGATGIPQSMFRGLPSEFEITIPEGVTTIGNYAFDGCTKLKSLKIPDSVTSIGYRAFANCFGLMELYLPVNSMTESANHIFEGCNGLQSIVVAEGTTRIPNYFFAGILSDFDIVLPTTLTSLGEGVFDGCTSLTGVNLPENITRINRRAFRNCDALKTLRIPDSVTVLEAEAFNGCDSLESIWIPAGVTSMGDAAFMNCPKLQTAGPAGGGYNIEFGWTTELPNNAFRSATGLTRLVIPEGITTIGEYGVENCGLLTEVVLPSTLKTVGYRAFRYDHSLTELHFPEGLTMLSNEAMISCNNLEWVTIPGTVTSMGDAVLMHCPKILTAGPIGGNYNLEFGWTEGLPNNAFRACYTLTKLVIPEGITSIGDYGVEYCQQLTNLTLPSTLKTIGYRAFRNDINLVKVALPDGVTTIGSESFQNCSNLLELEIPNSVNSIAKNAFYNSPNVCIVCSADSYALNFAIQNNLLVRINDWTRPESDIVDMSASYYNTNTTGTNASGYVDLVVHYQLKPEQLEKLSDMKLKILLQSKLVLVENSMRLDGEVPVGYSYKDNVLTVPVTAESGTLRFSVNPESAATLFSRAEFTYKKDGADESVIIDCINSDMPVLTMVMPKTVNTDEFVVSGIAPAEAALTFFIDDVQAGTTVASKAGNYSAELTLPDIQEGKSYIVKAVAAADGAVVEKSMTVTYDLATPVLEELLLYYSGHETGRYENYIVDLTDPHAGRTVITFNPTHDYIFRVKMSNPEQISCLYVTSTRNGQTKYIEAKYDEKTGYFVTKDKFDNDVWNYVPGEIGVIYDRTYPELDRTDLEGTAEALIDETAERIDKSTVSAEVIENTETDMVVQTVLPSGDEVGYEYHQFTTEDALAFLNENGLVPKQEGNVNPQFKIDDETIWEILEYAFDYVTFEEEETPYYLYATDDRLIIFSPFEPDTRDDMFSCWMIKASTSRMIDLCTMAENDDVYKILAGEGVNGGLILDATSAFYKYGNKMWELDLRRQNATPEDLAQIEKAENVISGVMAARITLAIMKVVLPTVFVTVPGIGLIVSVTAFFVEDYLDSVEESEDWITGFENSLIGMIMTFPYLLGEALALFLINNLLRWIIDPSGYVYEAVTTNRLPGVTATVYFQNPETGQAVLWDAGEYDQVNPIITGPDGSYAWDVPEGMWQVKYELDGYETIYSDWLPVPPPQTDVNVGMVSYAIPEAQWIDVYHDSVEIVFSKYMIPDTVDDIILTDANGSVIAYELEYSLDETSADGTVYAKNYTLDFDTVILDHGAVCVISIPKTVQSYAGVAAKAVKTEKVCSEQIQILTTETVTIPYGQQTVIPVSLTVAGFDAIEVVSMFTELASVDGISKTENGWEITVSGNLPGHTAILISIPGTNVSKYVELYVDASDGAHAHDYAVEVTQEPSCTLTGEKVYTCIICGETHEETIPALGHAFGEWSVIQEPTTSKEGIEENICTRCGHAEQRSIPKLKNPFTDVKPTDFYYDSVLWALENGITSGTSANKFAPYDSCLRSQVVTFLWRAAGKPAPTSPHNPFVDVKPTDYYYEAVLWAVEKGITTGANATHFEPNSICNRSQVVTFLYRAFGKPPIGNVSNPFTDISNSDWYAAPVLWAVKEGITSGLSATKFGPNEVCNRSQVVTFLYRAYN